MSASGIRLVAIQFCFHAANYGKIRDYVILIADGKMVEQSNQTPSLGRRVIQSARVAEIVRNAEGET